MLVEEIIDHHKDEKLYTNLNRTIEMVGSCATLVAEKLFESENFLKHINFKSFLKQRQESFDF